MQSLVCSSDGEPPFFQAGRQAERYRAQRSDMRAAQTGGSLITKILMQGFVQQFPNPRVGKIVSADSDMFTRFAIRQRLATSGYMH